MIKFLKRFLTLNHFSITVYITLLILVLFITENPFLNLAELKTIDLRFRYRGEIKPAAPVAIAAIDEKSLDREGKWPWPRAKLGELIDRLSEDGAKVIAFDIFFSEPDTNNNLIFIQQIDRKLKALKINNPELKKMIAENTAKADNDRALAEAIKRSRAKVILSVPIYQSIKEMGFELSAQELKERLMRVDGARYPLVRYQNPQVMREIQFLSLYAPEPNIEILNHATHALGVILATPDQDGVNRTLPLVINIGGEENPHLLMPLAIQALRQYLLPSQLMLEMDDSGVKEFHLGNRPIPTDFIGKMFINYLGPAYTFDFYSITEILHDKIPPGTFKDKIVLVGSTALGAHDLRVTPFSPNYPGVEIHATIIENILNQRFLSQSHFYKLFGFLAILLISLLEGLIIPRLNAVKGILFATGIFLFYLLLAQYLFSVLGVLINVVYPVLTLFLIYASLMTYHYFTEERRRKQLKNAFICYVSSSVVNEIIRDPAKLKLGGDQKELTVLFSDIRDFTRISEGLTAQELVLLLNEYLTVMTDVIFKYEGTLDKYIGDAIMAFFGAPLDQPDHPFKACHAALEMGKALEKLNQKWLAEGKKPFNIGIGINTGLMTVGNMGSLQRFDYTVIGDAVNLGSRLEGVNKIYDFRILISASTYTQIKQAFTCLELDYVKVQGKAQAIKPYQLIGTQDIPAQQKQAVTEFHQGLKLFHDRQWDAALQTFKTALALDPALNAAGFYMKRVAACQADPPPPDWDGSITMTSK